MIPLQPFLDKARRWCSLQERSALQVLTRLQKEGCPLPQATEILDILQQEGFQDDARLAQVYARSKAVHSAWGLAKIRQALQLMGVQDGPIAEALAQIDADAALARLDKTLLQKWDRLQGETDPRQRKAKLVRFLQQKGYSLSQIFAAIARLKLDT
ncbi:MAG: RecX family transcriptional regulator [Bacteroidetes bacterium]|nr:RecX family transcriptional regulator [Bacteroidota bacterium]